jgi:hypothetical protein
LWVLSAIGQIKRIAGSNDRQLAVDAASRTPTPAPRAPRAATRPQRAAEQQYELATLHRLVRDQESRANYGRLDPCIAAKAARPCPRWVISAGLTMSAVSLLSQQFRTVEATSQNRRFVPILLQKSPSRCCGIEIYNNRIETHALLNQRCLFELDFESIFRAEMLKILLQQYLPLAVIAAVRRTNNMEHPSRWRIGVTPP